MATIESLAPELLGEIFGHFPCQYSSRKLKAIALVCRRWREPAQRALFRDVTLSSERQAKLWLDSAARIRYPTKSLKGSLIQGTTRLDVLKACPDLETLITSYDAHIWAAGVQHPNKLRSLDMSAIPGEFPTTAMFPKLSRLEVAVGGSDDYLSSSLLESIFQPVCNSLTFLHLVFLDSTSTARSLVRILAAAPFPHVLYLVLEHCEVYKQWPNIFKAFPSLLTLEVSEEGCDRSTREASVIAVGASVAPTLEALIFTSRMSKDTLKQILHTVKLPNLGGLRRLEIRRVGKGDLAGETGLALLDECEERSISLLCRYGYLTRDMM